MAAPPRTTPHTSKPGSALFRRWRPWLGITLFSTLVALFIGWNLLFQIDGYIYDYGIISSPTAQTDDRIVILGIDEKFMAGRRVGLVPRDRLAHLIDNIAGARPAVIVLDVWLDARADEGLTAGDVALRNALQDARKRGIAVLLVQIQPGSVELPSSGLTAHEGTLPFFADAATATGHVGLDPDPDGIFRNLPETSPKSPSLPLLAAKHFLIAQGQSLAETLEQRLQRQVTPIEFAGPQGSIDVRPAVDFTRNPLLPENKDPAAMLRPLVKGKLVFIGATYLRSGDLFSTPYTRAAGKDTLKVTHRQTYGVQLLAQSTKTILDGAPRHSAATRPIWYAVAGWCFVIAALICALSMRGAAWAGVASIAGLAGVLALAYASARQPMPPLGSHSWPASPFMVATILASGLGVAYRQLEGAREIKLIKEVFAGHVSDEVIYELRGHMPPSAEMRDIAVLFCDIEGYSALAEKLRDDPIALLGELNAHFEPLVAALKKRGAYTDNYVGDLVMALFGAPTTRGSLSADTRNAVLAALEFIEIVHDRNAGRVAAGQAPIEVGVGVHCGPAVTGYLGSTQRLHYTAIGDTVNIASRVESTTRKYDTHLLVTKEVVEACRDAGELRGVEWEFVAETQVKGRVAPVRLYRFSGKSSRPSTPRLA